MSLDVYLTTPGQTHKYESRIFVREDGQTREMSRAEWDERFPGREPFVLNEQESESVFEYNITHNLNKMASEAGMYEPLWRPEGIGITKASQLIEPLRAGLERLVADPNKYKAFNPPNGWGDYAGLVRFVRSYLAACQEYPEAEVRA